MTKNKHPFAETKAMRFLQKKGYPFNNWDHYMKNFLQFYNIRDQFILKFGFAIMTASAIECIRPYAPIVEIGSGSGYWAYELTRAGIDVVATDNCSGQYADVKNHWKGHKWTEPVVMTATDAALLHPKRTLLTVWPDYNQPWPAQALKAYKGEHVIYVGEGYGGCTADNTFHHLLERDFDLVATEHIPQFIGTHDVLQIWKRKHKSNRTKGRPRPTTPRKTASR